MTLVKYLKEEIKCCGKLPISLDEKIEVGASIYVGLDEYPLEKNIEYLKQLKELKIEKVFISGHIPEMKDSFLEELKCVLNTALELDLKMILDISKPMYEKIFKELPKIYALRLDYGFTIEEIANMYNQGVILQNIRISHNFYPKKYTGLSREVVLEKNKILNKYGMKA